MLSTQPLKPAPRRSNDEFAGFIFGREEEDFKKPPRRNIDDDDLIAEMLEAVEMDHDPNVESDVTRAAREEDERLARQLRLQEEEELQVASVPGRAIRFVKVLLAFVAQKQKEFRLKHDEFSAVSKDSMVPMAEAFLTLQDSFRSQGKSTHVDLGFHYTAESNLNSIRDEGLLTKADRSARGVHSNNYNGENYGTGVYTADDPLSSCRYGNVGLIVARLRGRVATCTSSSMRSELRATAVYDHDTVEVPQVAYTVLRQSAQCVPLVQFKRDCFRFTKEANGYKHTSSNSFASMDIEVMTDLMKALQKELVDRKLINSIPSTCVGPANFTFGIARAGHPAATPKPPPFSFSAVGANHTAKQQQQHPFGNASNTTPVFAFGTSSQAVPANPFAPQQQQPFGTQPNQPSPFFVFGKSPTTANQHQQQSCAPPIFGAPAGAQLPVSSQKSQQAPTPSTFGSAGQASAPLFGQSQPYGFSFSRPVQAAFTFGKQPAVGSSQAAKSNTASVSQQSPCPPFSATTLMVAAGFNTSSGGCDIVEYKAPNTFSSLPEINTKFQSKRAAVNHGECSICLEDMKIGDLVTSLSPACDHQYHSACLQRHFAYQQRCPTCRTYLSHPQGTSPSGTMQVTIDRERHCGGYQCGTIVIKYEIPAGVQKEYHENPGAHHGRASRTAYLPDTNDGRKTLKRLKYAFLHGLVFTVGTSMTTRVKNSVTWASIHHKTKLVGGSHGYPDDPYFINVHEELDAAGVPPADSLS